MKHCKVTIDISLLGKTKILLLCLWWDFSLHLQSVIKFFKIYFVVFWLEIYACTDPLKSTHEIL